MKVQPNSERKSRAKRSADPHLAGAEEGIEQLAERLPHRRTEINPSTREHQTSDRILELRLLQVAGVDESSQAGGVFGSRISLAELAGQSLVTKHRSFARIFCCPWGENTSEPFARTRAVGMRHRVASTRFCASVPSNDAYGGAYRARKDRRVILVFFLSSDVGLVDLKAQLLR